MAKILFEYGGKRGQAIADIARSINKDTDLPQHLITNYVKYLSALGVTDTKETERFKKLTVCCEPTYAEYLEVIEEHNLTDEQARELVCVDDWIGYYYTEKETVKEKTKRVEQYSVENFCYYIHYVCYSISNDYGVDSYLGGTQHQLRYDIESAFKDDRLTTCKALMKEYIQRRYNLAGIED